MVAKSSCRIHLGGIITEGLDKGFMELRPAHYNVVLEDDTYKGQIKIGFRFITQVTKISHQAILFFPCNFTSLLLSTLLIVFKKSDLVAFGIVSSKLILDPSQFNNYI